MKSKRYTYSVPARDVARARTIIRRYRDVVGVDITLSEIIRLAVHNGLDTIEAGLDGLEEKEKEKGASRAG